MSGKRRHSIVVAILLGTLFFTGLGRALETPSSPEKNMVADTFATNGISMYYELRGDKSNPPVLLIAGLGGMGVNWEAQIGLFAEKFYVILPDQRGTGRSSRTMDGYTTEQLASDIASLIEHLELGAVHVVGSSTGGAIAQYMALNHPDTVRTLTISSSFAHFDEYIQREFKVRRKIAAEWTDRAAVYDATALFLFSPRFVRDNPRRISEWINRVISKPVKPEDHEITLKRIDMVAAHDAFSRLGDIDKPTLVLCGRQNACTPLPLSEEIAQNIPGAKLVVIEDAGELIEIEKEQEFYTLVSDFLIAN